MIIKKVRLENIRSYENQEIFFPKGSTLLSGDIGSGKTSVLLAIEFALFGLQPSQRGNSLLRNGKNEGGVVLEFEIQGKKIIIERTLKRSKKSITQDYSSITIDNEKEEASVTEIKTRLLDLLNYPSEFAKKTNLVYKFTVYTPQEEMKQIILESKEARLNTLRHVFGIDKYKRIEENLNIFKIKLREKIREKQGQVSDIEEIKKNFQEKQNSLFSINEDKEKQKNLFEQKKEAREKIEKETKETEEKIKEKEELEKEKYKLNFSVKNKQEILYDLEQQIEKLEKEIEEDKKVSFNENRLKEIENLIKLNKEKQKSSQEKMIDLSSQLNSFQKTKEEAEKLNEKISKLDKCPTCLQEVNQEYKENIFSKIKSEIAEINEKSKTLQGEKANIIKNQEKLSEEEQELNQQKSEQEIKKIKAETFKEKQKNLEQIQDKKRKLSLDLETNKKEVESLEEKIQQYSRFSILFEEKIKELDEARTQEKNQEIKVAELNKEISLLESSIKEVEKQLQEKNQVVKKLEYLKGLESWVTERFINLVLFTEKNVMLKLKDDFSKLFTEWFSVLVPESLTARLDEEFTPIIEQQGYETFYGYLSGGERTAVALAYRLALNQVLNSLLSKINTRDLVILDEPTDGFSDQQLDKMRDVLSQLNVSQLILVSHEAKIESFVENIIKFRKEGGVTKVET